MGKLRKSLREDLDKIITKWHLHDRWDEPVNIEPAIEKYRKGFRRLAGRRDAVTYHFFIEKREFYRIIYDWSLEEADAITRRRHISGHEAGHVFGKHFGTQFGVKRGRSYSVGLAKWLEKQQETECEYVAAYFLVPLKALKQWACYDMAFIAKKLDVPEHLVRLRREIMSDEEASNMEIEAQQALFIW